MIENESGLITVEKGCSVPNPIFNSGHSTGEAKGRGNFKTLIQVCITNQINKI